MTERSYAALAKVFKIEWDGEYCSPTCPQLIEGLCDRFSGTLEEQKIAKEFTQKLRWKGCKDAVELFQHIILA